MPYNVGAATSTANILATIDTVLTAGGWTRDKFVDNAGSGDEYYWNDGAAFFVSAAQIADGIKLYANTGFNTGAAVNAQPGVQVAVGDAWDAAVSSLTSGTANVEGQLSNCAGPYTAHHIWLDQRFDKDYLICAIEQVPGVMRWFGFGTIRRDGTPPISRGEFVMTDGWVQIGPNETASQSQGGPFSNTNAGGSEASFVIRMDLDGAAEDWYGNQNAPAGNSTVEYVFSTNGFGSNRGPGSDFLGDDSDAFAVYSGFYPQRACKFFVTRDLGDTTPGAISIVGGIPAMLFVNNEKFDTGQVVEIDGDDYLIFPQGRKNPPGGSAPSPNSGYFGVAMLRDL